MVTFVNSYSYNRPFDGSHNVKVALSENEFDTPDLEGLKTLERVAMIVNCHGRLGAATNEGDNENAKWINAYLFTT